MKKFLLFSGLGLVCLSASAASQVYEDQQISALSANGKWAVSELFETVSLINLETGEIQTFTPDDSGMLVFSAGTGNCVADDGTFVGNYSMSSPATIFRNGDYVTLPQENPSAEAHPNGITPDGRVICGSISTGFSAMDDHIALVPCVWIRDEGGNYGMPVLLPHPELDFTGRVPQYVTAVRISEDGKTIAGQMRDFMGMFSSPIIYTLGDDGNWTYTQVHPELQNPDGIKFPEYPGDGPMQPTQEEYMTAQEKQAFEDALNEYYAGERDEAPSYDEFMTDEEIEAYEKALQVWVDAYEKWEADYTAFNNAYLQCADNGCSFVFNNIFLSSDGRLLATTDYKEVLLNDDPIEPLFDTHYTPYIFNLSDGTYSHFSTDINHLISALADDGTILTRDLKVEPEQTEARLTDGTYLTFYDFVNGRNATVGAWVKENMYHDMEVYDPEAGGLVWKENMPVFGGYGVCTPSLSRIATTSFNYWNEQVPVQYYSYLFDMDDTLSVEGVAAAPEADVKVLAGGVIATGAGVKAVEVYDMQGRRVFGVEDPAGSVATGLAAGVYVVKATGADGGVRCVKAAF